MAKALKACAFVLSFVTIAVPLFASKAAAGQMGLVTRDGINIRSRPNIGGAKLGTVNKGEHVYVLGRRYEWYKIAPPSGIYFYVSSKYIYNDPSGDSFCSADNVNVRVAPSLEADIAGRLRNGQRVVVIKDVGGWSQIEPPDGTAVYIHEKFVKLIESQPLQDLGAKKTTRKAQPEKDGLLENEDENIQAKEEANLSISEDPLPGPSTELALESVKGLLAKAGGLFGGRYRFKLLDEYGKDVIFYLEPFNQDVNLRLFLDQIVQIEGVATEKAYKGKTVFVVRSVAPVESEFEEGSE